MKIIYFFPSCYVYASFPLILITFKWSLLSDFCLIFCPKQGSWVPQGEVADSDILKSISRMFWAVCVGICNTFCKQNNQNYLYFLPKIGDLKSHSCCGIVMWCPKPPWISKMHAFLVLYLDYCQQKCEIDEENTDEASLFFPNTTIPSVQKLGIAL